jgi:hypothetical protein
MLITAIKILIVIVLGFLFAYIYGLIEHGYIPPAEHLRLRFFNHFANYHITMFALFSALPIVVLVFLPNLLGVLVSLGLWTYLPFGEDIAWYHFSGTWPAPEDWTSWGGGYHIAGRWVPRWYLASAIVATLFYALAVSLALSRYP